MVRVPRRTLSLRREFKKRRTGREREKTVKRLRCGTPRDPTATRGRSGSVRRGRRSGTVGRRERGRPTLSDVVDERWKQKGQSCTLHSQQSLSVPVRTAHYLPTCHPVPAHCTHVSGTLLSLLRARAVASSMPPLPPPVPFRLSRPEGVWLREAFSFASFLFLRGISASRGKRKKFKSSKGK